MTLCADEDGLTYDEQPDHERMSAVSLFPFFSKAKPNQLVV